jgi:hypothetical protein
VLHDIFAFMPQVLMLANRWVGGAGPALEFLD